MFYIDNGILYNSDWHLYHKKVRIYEFEKRQVFIDKVKYPNIKNIDDIKNFYNLNIKTQEVITEFILDAEYNMFNAMYESLKDILQKNKIHRYINLGDFMFNATDKKILEYKETKNYDLVCKIFDLFQTNLIPTELYLGNHDNFEKASEFYNSFFDDVCNYSFSMGILLSHFPYSQKNNFFIENKLLPPTTIVKKSIHGHTHGNIANETTDIKNKNIEYINVSIEQFI